MAACSTNTSAMIAASSAALSGTCLYSDGRADAEPFGDGAHRDHVGPPVSRSSRAAATISSTRADGCSGTLPPVGGAQAVPTHVVDRDVQQPRQPTREEDERDDRERRQDDQAQWQPRPVHEVVDGHRAASKLPGAVGPAPIATRNDRSGRITNPITGHTGRSCFTTSNPMHARRKSDQASQRNRLAVVASPGLGRPVRGTPMGERPVREPRHYSWDAPDVWHRLWLTALATD